VVGVSSSLLENEPETKLQLAHAVRCVRGSIGLDRVYHSASAAVDTGVALGGTEAQNWMIEHVVRVEAELRLVFFSDAEILG